MKHRYERLIATVFFLSGHNYPISNFTNFIQYMQHKEILKHGRKELEFFFLEKLLWQVYHSWQANSKHGKPIELFKLEMNDSGIGLEFRLKI